MAELHEIKGIGPATATRLAEHGLTSVKRLAKADLDAIVAVPGFGPVRAAAVRDAARAALPAPAQADTPKAAKATATKPKASKAKASKAKRRDKGTAKGAKGAKATAVGTAEKAKKPGKGKRTEKSGKGKKKAKKR